MGAESRRGGVNQLDGPSEAEGIRSGSGRPFPKRSPSAGLGFVQRARQSSIKISRDEGQSGSGSGGAGGGGRRGAGGRAGAAARRRGGGARGGGPGGART